MGRLTNWVAGEEMVVMGGERKAWGVKIRRLVGEGKFFAVRGVGEERNGCAGQLQRGGIII